MKICFSTLGCPSWSFGDIVSTAKDFGYDGIEVRGIENELYVPAIKAFTPLQIESSKQKLQRLGLEIPCLTSGILLFEKSDACINEAIEYMDTASKLGVKYIRLLADKEPEPGKNISIDVIFPRLEKIAQYGKKIGIMPLIETNGVFSDSNKILELLEKVNSDNVGIIWDINHPYHFAGESVTDTYTKLKKYIKHVHIKDSIKENGKIVYTMIGEGELPIIECVKMLKDDGFEGYLSLEWLKRWYSELGEPGVVFMQFIEYIKAI